MKAIVFDNAGTILQRVTALKDVTNNNILFETNTIGMVNNNDESLILVFQTPAEKLIQEDKKIVDYLKENMDSFEISYSTSDYTKNEAIEALCNDTTEISEIKESARGLINRYNIEICSGSALIVNMNKKRIEYAYTAGGLFFKGTSELIKTLKKLDYEIFIASGDNKHSLVKIANLLNIPLSNINDTCNSNCKKKIVSKLQKEYDNVIMVGNNTNDYLAIKQADIGILTTEQGELLPDFLLNSADYTVDNISDVLKIVEGEV